MDRRSFLVGIFASAVSAFSATSYPSDRRQVLVDVGRLDAGLNAELLQAWIPYIRSLYRRGKVPSLDAVSVWMIRRTRPEAMSVEVVSEEDIRLWERLEEIEARVVLSRLDRQLLARQQTR